MTRDVRAIVIDIEGTVSSIAFVRDVLFPYARDRLPGFVAARGHTPEVRRQLDAARALAGEPELDDAALVARLQRWIDEDRKATPLKALQGLIWADGYENGDLVATLYPDAVTALRTWHADGFALYVYSSGSVLAQKLLFGHTSEGDLQPLFNGFFDTTTGPKLEAPSYEAIVDAIGVPGHGVLFLSDSIGELDAARAAGLRTIALDRGEAVLRSGHTHASTDSFAHIDARTGEVAAV
ncbi:acireductone synthase [Pararobbsia silviterrae]|uniref:Enolase-phosphatase E1 n=1 Tax=Pararobbsia silviterrae TaxID=1792498 RepID=A0A494XQ24_9BURK|nr:acireductone synthase [Pararobbsia silviterrae]RKP49633.1 acireductone synthase [Pararobbsia silviterrae]